MWCNGGTMGFWGWTMMITAWGAVAAMVVWAVRYSDGRRGGSATGALEILERRYAAGEIEREGYEERRRLLELRR